MKDAVRDAVPQWSQPDSGRGIDPLGMQNSSIRLYQTLLPGIGNLTQRIRYYGLYVWLADWYAREFRDPDTATWKKYIRRAEALYVLIALQNGDGHAVAGAKWASSCLDAAGLRRIDFSTYSDPGRSPAYLASTWGVFGLAYESQLHTAGVLQVVDGREVPAPASGYGIDLARAFAKQAGAAGQLFLSTLLSGTTTRAALIRMADLSPSAIAGNERTCYQKVLMSPPPPFHSSHQLRSYTLRLVLGWAAATGKPVTSFDLRWSLYAGRIGVGRRWELSNELEKHRRRWAVYQANELCHFALETLLAVMINALEESPAGKSIDQWIADAVEGVSMALPTSGGTWSDFVHAQRAVDDPSYLDEEGSEAQLAEHIWMSRGHLGSDEAACAIRLLAVLQKRMTGWMADLDAALPAPENQGFRSLRSELAFLRSREKGAFADVLAGVLRERIVQRHVWVAMRKLRYQGDYTFLFDLEDDRARKLRSYVPVWTSPRLTAAIGFLQDIKLLDHNGITPSGRQALEAP